MTAEDLAAIRRERLIETTRLDPQIPIILKGQKYTLEMNNFAVKGILKDTGHNIIKLGVGLDQLTDPVVVGSILFWALRTGHPDLTQDDVDKLYTHKHYAYVMERLVETVRLFLPDMTGLEETPMKGLADDPLKPSAPNGSATGHSGEHLA